MPTQGRIVIDPNIMLGKPVIRGTRVTVELILRKLGEGASPDDLLEAYPHLSGEDIQAAMTYAADALAHEDIVLVEPNAWMRFLADESCDFRIVQSLRAAGHDVMTVKDVAPGADDHSVIGLAAREDRIFITEDRDFGQLIYAAAKPAPGVILVRYPSSSRAGLPSLMASVVARHGDRLRGSFAVIQPGRVRIGTVPRE